VVKVKTSIYIDRDLWSSFKEYASKSGVEVGKIGGADQRFSHRSGA